MICPGVTKPLWARAKNGRKKGRNRTKTHYFQILQMQKVGEKFIQSAPTNAGTFDFEINWV
jgi:hypothetical protein